MEVCRREGGREEGGEGGREGGEGGRGGEENEQKNRSALKI